MPRRLAVKVIKAEVWRERIPLGKPQQDGRPERLHLTLLRDTANPPVRSLCEQIDRFGDFQRVYNEERPHAALGEHDTASPQHREGLLASRKG